MVSKLKVPKGYEAWRARGMKERLALAEKHSKDEKEKVSRYISIIDDPSKER